jgi:pyruvate dehydrogenase E1 component beta subunit
MSTQKIEMREALRQAIDEEMEQNEKVFVMGEEVGEYNGAYKITKGMLDKWGPKRIVDTPISELGFSGLCIGAAMTGLRPIVEFMSFNFSFVAADQLISNAIKMYYMSGNRFSVPIVFRGPNGAAAQVSSQHSHCVEAIYGNLPGWKILSPSNAYDAKGLLKTAIF